MHQYVSKCDDLRPRHFGMKCLEILRHASGGLTDYLQVVDYLDLEHFVALKGISAIGNPLSDFRDGFEDTGQTIRVAPHRVIASR
jgi:hypothetical protein